MTGACQCAIADLATATAWLPWVHASEARAEELVAEAAHGIRGTLAKSTMVPNPSGRWR